MEPLKYDIKETDDIWNLFDEQICNTSNTNNTNNTNNINLNNNNKKNNKKKYESESDDEELNENEIDEELEEELEDSDDENIECCINCGAKDSLLNDNEMLVCTICGCENEQILDFNPEWRWYGMEDHKRSADPNRCGLPTNPLISEGSAGPVMLGYGNEIYRRLNSWNGIKYKDRSLMNVLTVIKQKANLNDVPQSVVDKTLKMYKMIKQDYIKRGTSKDGLIAACFINALRDNGIMRDHEEIAKLFDIKSKKLTDGCNEFENLMFDLNKDYIKAIKPVTTIDHINNYTKLLEFTEEQKKDCLYAEYMIREKTGLCQGNNPKSIAVGIIYLISSYHEMNFTKREVARYCRTTEVTITNTFNKLVKWSKFLIRKYKPKQINNSNYDIHNNHINNISEETTSNY